MKIAGLLLALFIFLTLITPAFASFDMERPSATIEGICERAENVFADSEAAVGVGVNVAWYVEDPDPSIGPFFGDDGFVLRVAGTANTRKGIEYETDYEGGVYYDISPHAGDLLYLDDNDGLWVDLPFEVAFYTGPGLQDSSLYSKVWVCSNGFLLVSESEG